MRRLSYEWLDGLREIVIDSNRCPLAFSEFTLKEFERDKEGDWTDDIPDGQDHVKCVTTHSTRLTLFVMSCPMTCSGDEKLVV